MTGFVGGPLTPEHLRDLRELNGRINRVRWLISQMRLGSGRDDYHACPGCGRYITSTKAGKIVVHNVYGAGAAGKKCKASGKMSWGFRAVPVDLHILDDILAGKEVSLIGNEFVRACGAITSESSVADVGPLVEWYTKQEGNADGGALASVLFDGNITDAVLHKAIDWARESGDWYGHSLGQAIVRIEPAQRRLLVENYTRVIRPKRKRSR